MSDFDAYEGQNCRCGNDPGCTNCNAGHVFAQQEAYRTAMERAEAEHYDALMRDHYESIDPTRSTT